MRRYEEILRFGDEGIFYFVPKSEDGDYRRSRVVACGTGC